MPRKPEPDDNLEFDLGDLNTPAESSEKSPTDEKDPELVEDIANADECSNDVFNLDTQGDYVDGMFGGWFLDYASYVILERAVPHAFDGSNQYKGEFYTQCGSLKTVAITKWLMSLAIQ